MKRKLLALIPIFFLLIFSSVAVSAGNVPDEPNAGPSITWTNIPVSVIQNEPFTVSADASGNSGISMTLYRSPNLLDWTTLDNEICSGSTCSVSSNEQLSVIGIYYYKVTATDSSGTRVKIEDVQVYADTTDPIFSNYGENPADPATYAPGQTYTFTVEVTDDVGIDTVTFVFDGQNYATVNTAGNTWQATVTDLAADNYDYTWGATDVNGNSVTSPVQTYTVDRADSTATISFLPSATEEYGTETTTTCTIDNTEQVGLEDLFIDDGTGAVSVSNPHVATLDVNTYTYSCTVVQTQNYTQETATTQDLTITKATPVLSLTLDDGTGPVEGDLAVEYGTETTAFGSVTTGDTGATVELTRDDVGTVLNPDVATLDVNTYVYTFTYTESANYNAGSVQRTLDVTRMNPDLQCTVNSATFTYPDPTTVTCTINNVEQLPIEITMFDGTSYTDITAQNGIPMNLGAGDYQFNASVAESTNYQADTWGPEAHIINKGQATLTLTLDGVAGDITRLAPATYLVESTKSVGEGTILLFVDTVSTAWPIDFELNQNNMPIADYTYRIELDSANYEATPIERIAHVVADPEAPQFYNEFTNPATGVVYAPGATYTFDIDWIDNLAVDTVSFTFGGIPYVPVNTAGDTWEVVITGINAGNYTYEWTASDAQGNTNQTGALDYEVKHNITTLHVALDGIQADQTYSAPANYNVAAWRDVTEGTLLFTRDGVPQTNLAFAENSVPVGQHVYVLTLTAQNYIAAPVTRIATIGDTTPPIITITNPVDYTSNDTTLDVTTNEASTCYFGIATNPTDIMDVTGAMTHTTPLTGLPLGTNEYFVRCVDQFGNENETSVTWEVVNSYNITLDTGWNLISLPLIPSQPVLTSDTSIWGTNYIIQYYDNAGTLFEYDFSNPGAANLNQVVPDLGYWIYVDTSRTVTILGDEPGQRTIQLLEGVNMIGWTSLDTTQMDLALNSIMTNVSWVQLQNMTDVTQKILQEAILNSDSFEPGKGYFINVTNDTTWTYPENIAPTADAGIDQVVYVLDPVTLDGSGSYDLDGSIVSYSWTVDGTTETGVNPTFTFDMSGTYTITLTVTDNEGATDTDTVDVVVSAYSNGGGGGGFGGIPPSYAPSSSGFILIELTAPEAVSVTQGSPVTFTATVTNVGDTNVYDIAINGDPDWITVVPPMVTELGKNESADFQVTVTLPEGIIGTNYLVLTATGRHENSTATSDVTIEIIGNPEQCDNCEQPTPWTTCNVNGTQTRTVYTCDESSGYACVETIETRDCGGITGYFLYISDHPLVSGVVALIIIITLAGLIHAQRKGKLKGISKTITGTFKGLKGKKTSGGKKSQGIDFNIEYKKSFDGDTFDGGNNLTPPGI